MTRIILFTGKGGVGKTTVAAATGLAAAKLGYRTLVLSFDLAHSLSDSFDLDTELFQLNDGLPRKITDGLEIQEIDVQGEMGRHWGEIAKYATVIMSSTGLSNVVAEEMAVLPGMEDVIALLYLNQYYAKGAYDLIVVDCPPTSESLRFVNITSILQWYMNKRFNFDRKLIKYAGPIASRFADLDLPDDSHFASMERLYHQLSGIDDVLLDPAVTTVRLVTNPEKMVIRETQRAFMYFNMYGLTIDAIILNRLLTDMGGAMSRWAESHAKHAAGAREYFDPVSVSQLPLFPTEVVGKERLFALAERLYGDKDPTNVFITERPYNIVKNGEGYEVTLKLPFAKTQDVDLSRKGHDLIIRIGSFKRFIPLPRATQDLKVLKGSIDEGTLTVHFGPGGDK